MMIQRLPDGFFTENQLRTMTKDWAQRNSLPSFKRLIPFFFDLLAELDSPSDVWFVRDIAYNSGKEILEKEEMLTSLASMLSDCFVKDVYLELRGKTTALEFVKSLHAIAAEIRCAELIKGAGAENITKCTTPEDVSCTYNGTRLGFQVKFKGDEDFTKGLIEEAVIGEMYKQSSQFLRDYSDFSIDKCADVRRGFLSDSIDYIHLLLPDHLQQKGGSHRTTNLNANLTERDGKFYLDVSGLGNYKQSFLTIAFRRNHNQILGGAKIALKDQEPEAKLWEFLKKKIEQVPYLSNLVGWLDLEMSFQYENYLLNELSRKRIVAFLENYSIPLVLRAKVKFGERTQILFSNKAAMLLPLIGNLLSKEQQAGVT